MTPTEIIAAIAALSDEDRTVVLTGAYGSDLDQAVEELKRRFQPKFDRLLDERDRAMTAAENASEAGYKLAHAADFAVQELGKARARISELEDTVRRQGHPTAAEYERAVELLAQQATRIGDLEARLTASEPPIRSEAIADTGDHDDVCQVCHNAVDYEHHTWEDCARGMARQAELPCQGCDYQAEECRKAASTIEELERERDAARRELRALEWLALTVDRMWYGRDAGGISVAITTGSELEVRWATSWTAAAEMLGWKDAP